MAGVQLRYGTRPFVHTGKDVKCGFSPITYLLRFHRYCKCHDKCVYKANKTTRGVYVRE